MESKNELKVKWINKPKEWEDDTRMNALFATFRPRELNPVYYDAKIKFWKEAILSIANENDIFIINEYELCELFIRNGIKPKCLDIVVQYMLKETKIQRYNDFLRSQKSWKEYFSDKLWSPVTITKSYFSRMFLSTQKNDENENLLVKEVLHRKAYEIHKILQENIVYPEIECLIDYEKFCKICNERQIQTQTQIELILLDLMSNNKILVITADSDCKKLIKFSPNETDSVKPINELEKSYYLLKLTEKKLENEIEKHQADIDSLDTQIKAHLSKKKKMDAISSLKRKKIIEKTISKKYQILENLHAMILNIEQSDTNKSTLTIYKKSLDAIKEANKSFDLDNIEDTLSEIQDIFAQNTEIGELLSKSVVQTQDVDEKDLEDELKNLIGDANASILNTSEKNDSSLDNALEKFGQMQIDDVLDHVFDKRLAENSDKKAYIAN